MEILSSSKFSNNFESFLYITLFFFIYKFILRLNNISVSEIKNKFIWKTFRHNLVDGVISSTVNKKPSFIEYVEDGTGSINLFVD